MYETEKNNTFIMKMEPESEMFWHLIAVKKEEKKCLVKISMIFQNLHSVTFILISTVSARITRSRSVIKKNKAVRQYSGIITLNVEASASHKKDKIM